MQTTYLEIPNTNDIEEITPQAVKRLKRGKAPGHHMVTTEMI